MESDRDGRQRSSGIGLRNFSQVFSPFLSCSRAAILRGVRDLKMRFLIHTKGPGQSRHGVITGFSHKSFETPACIFYTHAGSVPHLTWDSLQHLKGSSEIPILISMPSVVNISKAVKEFGKGISKFVGLQEYVPCVSVQDPAAETLSGYNDRKTVSVWNCSGRFKLSVDEYIRTQEAFKPCWYQALCDSDTPRDCSSKRIQNSVERSLMMLDECIERHLKSEQLKKSSIFGTIQGGYDETARQRSAKETALRPVAGFVIDGFHSNGPKVEKLDFEEVIPILRTTVHLLPEDKPKVMNGTFSPKSILQAVECGIDVFDTSYPYILTERGSALVLPDFTKINELQEESSSCEMNLNDKKFAADFSPIIKQCSCYTCKHFSRAYIHHLLSTSELLSSVLLMLHNLHVFIDFFAVIRKSLSDGTFDQLKKALCS